MNENSLFMKSTKPIGSLFHSTNATFDIRIDLNVFFFSATVIFEIPDKRKKSSFLKFWLIKKLENKNRGINRKVWVWGQSFIQPNQNLYYTKACVSR
jgi:hypothetical protein